MNPQARAIDHQVDGLSARGFRNPQLLAEQPRAPTQRRVVRDLDTEPEKRGDRVQEAFGLSVGELVHHPDNQARFNRHVALLTQIQAPLVSVAADSAYDKEAVYEAIEAHSPGRRTRVVIPPQRNATLSQNSNTAMQERDRHIRAIERHGRREWYKLSGYTKRSMVENAVYRYKAIIGPEMRARTLARQRVEHRIGCEILNKMAALGMPDTYCAG